MSAFGAPGFGNCMAARRFTISFFKLIVRRRGESGKLLVDDGGGDGHLHLVGGVGATLGQDDVALLKEREREAKGADRVVTSEGGRSERIVLGPKREKSRGEVLNTNTNRDKTQVKVKVRRVEVRVSNFWSTR